MNPKYKGWTEQQRWQEYARLKREYDEKYKDYDEKRYDAFIERILKALEL